MPHLRHSGKGAEGHKHLKIRIGGIMCDNTGATKYWVTTQNWNESANTICSLLDATLSEYVVDASALTPQQWWFFFLCSPLLCVRVVGWASNTNKTF